MSREWSYELHDISYHVYITLIDDTDDIGHKMHVELPVSMSYELHYY